MEQGIHGRPEEYPIIDRDIYEYEGKIVEEWERGRWRNILLQELNKTLDSLLDWNI